MKRENLDFLDNEQVEKVMTLYGKAIAKKEAEIEKLTESNKELTEKVNTYETKINEFNESAKDNAEWKIKYEELQTSIDKQEAERKAKEEDEILTKNIDEVFGDKKFTSDYARAGLTKDIKDELNKPENKGKSIKDIFDVLTKDKTDIFANPNQMKDMAGMGESEEKADTKEMPLIW